MENLLHIVEQDSVAQDQIDEDRLKFFKPF